MPWQTLIWPLIRKNTIIFTVAHQRLGLYSLDIWVPATYYLLSTNSRDDSSRQNVLFTYSASLLSDNGAASLSDLTRPETRNTTERNFLLNPLLQDLRPWSGTSAHKNKGTPWSTYCPSAGSDQRQAGGMKRARQSGSSTKWGKMKICHAEEKTRSPDGDFGRSHKGWRQWVKSGAASRVTFNLCPQVIWICCLSSADTFCLIYAGKGGWGVIRFDGWWNSPLSRVILMPAALMTAQFNKFTVKRCILSSSMSKYARIFNFWQ